MKFQKLMIIALIALVIVMIAAADNGYDYSDESSYSDPEFYKNSDSSQWDYTKVDYSMINDHSKIDPLKYLFDNGCVGCTINKDLGGLVTYSSKGMLHANGDFMSIPGTYPGGSQFLATPDGFEVILPQSVGSIELPAEDQVTIDTDGMFVVLPDDAVINGRLSFNNGEPYVKKGDTAMINGVDIFDKYDDVEIYFDSPPADAGSPYVYFGENDFEMGGGTEQEPFNLKFHRTNGYVYMDIGDLFEITSVGSGNIKIINHDDIRKAPEVIVTGPDSAAEWAIIDNGRLRLHLGKDYTTADAEEALNRNFGSVHMEIYAVGKDGFNIIKNSLGSESKIVIDEENNLRYTDAFSSLSFYTAEAGCEGCVLEWCDETGDLIRDLCSGDLNSDFFSKHNIRFKDFDKMSDEQKEKFMDNLEKLQKENPELYSHIRQIFFQYEPDVEWAGMAQGGFNLMYMNTAGGVESYSVLAHEAGHLKHFDLEDKEEFDRKWLEITDEGVASKGIDMYYNDKNYPANKEYLKDGGWTRSYGSSSYHEDVATFVEQISDTGTVRGYDSEPKVQEKVKLLCEYGFLPADHKLCKY